MSQTAPGSQRATVAVIGLGSIGGVVAGCLRAADRHDVIACVRQPLDRLTVERPEGAVEVALRALTDPIDAQTPIDWVLLATKAHHTASAAPWLARLCGPSTRVAVLQNGIDHAARVAPFIGAATAVPIMVYFNGERLAPDRVRMRPVGKAADMEAADDAGGRAFAQLLQGSGLSVQLLADFKTQAWRKLLINAVANPMTCLVAPAGGAAPPGHPRAVPGGAGGGRRGGPRRRRPAGTSRRDHGEAHEFGPELVPMYFDRLAGRELEVEALTGAIVAAGRRLGIPTPLNQVLLTLLRALSEGATM
jgi:2-dehydropantoate 2-reductase